MRLEILAGLRGIYRGIGGVLRRETGPYFAHPWTLLLPGKGVSVGPPLGPAVGRSWSGGESGSWSPLFLVGKQTQRLVGRVAKFGVPFVRNIGPVVPILLAGVEGWFSWVGMSCIRFGRTGLLAAVLGLAMSWQAQGSVVLRIDISNPEEVRFTATGAFAQNDDLEETYLQEGFTLLGFFNDEFISFTESFGESTLFSPGGDFAYTTLFITGISGPEVDLNIAGSGFSYQDFSTAAPAFTGFATANLASWLPYVTVGRTGNILAGDVTYHTVVIGQYEVVPEPSTWAMIFGGGLLLGLAKFLRKRKATLAG